MLPQMSGMWVGLPLRTKRFVILCVSITLIVVGFTIFLFRLWKPLEVEFDLDRPVVAS